MKASAITVEQARQVTARKLQMHRLRKDHSVAPEAVIMRVAATTAGAERQQVLG